MINSCANYCKDYLSAYLFAQEMDLFLELEMGAIAISWL